MDFLVKILTGTVEDLITQVLLCSSRKTPHPPHRRSSEIPRGRGVLKVKILEAKDEAKLEFPRGSRGAKQKTFRGGSMDIFWNCTFDFMSSNLLTLKSSYRWLGTAKTFFFFC